MLIPNPFFLHEAGDQEAVASCAENNRRFMVTVGSDVAGSPSLPRRIVRRSPSANCEGRLGLASPECRRWVRWRLPVGTTVGGERGKGDASRPQHAQGPPARPALA